MIVLCLHMYVTVVEFYAFEKVKILVSAAPSYKKIMHLHIFLYPRIIYLCISHQFFVRRSLFNWNFWYEKSQIIHMFYFTTV